MRRQGSKTGPRKATDQKAGGYQPLKHGGGVGAQTQWRLISQNLRHGLISEQDASQSLLMNQAGRARADSSGGRFLGELTVFLFV